MIKIWKNEAVLAPNKILSAGELVGGNQLDKGASEPRMVWGKGEGRNPHHTSLP